MSETRQSRRVRRLSDVLADGIDQMTFVEDKSAARWDDRVGVLLTVNEARLALVALRRAFPEDCA